MTDPRPTPQPSTPSPTHFGYPCRKCAAEQARADSPSPEGAEPRTEANVWAIAGITELQRMLLAQNGYRITPVGREAALPEGQSPERPLRGEPPLDVDPELKQLRRIALAAGRVSDAAISSKDVKAAEGTRLMMALGELDAELGKPLRRLGTGETE